MDPIAGARSVCSILMTSISKRQLYWNCSDNQATANTNMQMMIALRNNLQHPSRRTGAINCTYKQLHVWVKNCSVHERVCSFIGEKASWKPSRQAFQRPALFFDILLQLFLFLKDGYSAAIPVKNTEETAWMLRCGIRCRKYALHWPGRDADYLHNGPVVKTDVFLPDCTV